MSCDDRVPDARCCESCHEDHNDYGIDMVFVDNWTTEVCCSTARALEKIGVE